MRIDYRQYINDYPDESVDDLTEIIADEQDIDAAQARKGLIKEHKLEATLIEEEANTPTVKLGVNPFPTVELPRRTRLYHATASQKEFEYPRGHAWFAYRKIDAQAYLEFMRRGVSYWPEDVSADRSGTPRVQEFIVVKSPVLLDLRRKYWEDFAFEVAGYAPDSVSTDAIYDLALLVCEEGFDGWQSRTEVMLCNPQIWLRRV